MRETGTEGALRALEEDFDEDEELNEEEHNNTSEREQAGVQPSDQLINNKQLVAVRVQIF